ncbi:10777_t:CDS:1, partial [Funneliformis caledonium]
MQVFTDPYFENTASKDFQFLDYYRHWQKQADFYFSFSEEADRLWRYLKSLADFGLDNVKSAAKRMQSLLQ